MSAAIQKALELHPAFVSQKSSLNRTAAEDKEVRDKNLVRSTICDGTLIEKAYALSTLSTEDVGFVHPDCIFEQAVTIYEQLHKLMLQVPSVQTIDQLFEEIHASVLTNIDNNGKFVQDIQTDNYVEPDTLSILVPKSGENTCPI